jgi:lipopolysaccharide biosynthesis glycosyltransferase
MKIIIYTVVNDAYVTKLKMMLNSFFTFNSSIDFHVLSASTQPPVFDKNTKIILHDASSLFQNYLEKYRKPSYACKKIKSLITEFVNINDYDLIIYTDCDVIFYDSINKFIFEKTLDTINFSYDGGTYRNFNKYNICTGFFYFSPNKFPNLLKDWSVEIDTLVTQRPKFLDQPAMKNIVKTSIYNNNFSLISLEEISQKFKRNNVIATHYIRRRGYNMYNDYASFFNNEFNQL